MAVEGPMARSVSDLRMAYEILSGRDPRDPVSVDAPLYGTPPLIRKVALVTDIPGVTLPAHHVNAIEAAGDAMAEAGWEVEHAVLPELELVTEIWARILAKEFSPALELYSQIMSAPAHKLIVGLCNYYPEEMSLPEVHRHRWRLSCAWSEFFEEFPVIIGPTWTNDPFLHNADIAPGGTDLTLDILRFITPANLLGLPASAVPTGTHDGLPTGCSGHRR
ncbi:MAG: amidase [Candidatus Azotimanducaceae bacterium]|jgi:amidase